MSSFGSLHSETVEWDHLYQTSHPVCLNTQPWKGHTTWSVDLSHQVCSKLNWAVLGFIIELWN